LSVSVADSCYITCPKTRLKVILEYLEEGWLGRTQNRVIGVIYKYDPDNDTKTKIKEVAETDIVGRIEGCWMDKIYYTLGSEPITKTTEKIILIDLNPLFPVPKICPPMEEQLPNESRKFWDGVTVAILNKQFGLATTLKTELEEKQRAKAAERKEKNTDWQVRFRPGFLRLPCEVIVFANIIFVAAEVFHRRCNASWTAEFDSRWRNGSEGSTYW
jgi:hypothetical protein